MKFSLNEKVFFFIAGLILILAVLVFKAITIHQRKAIWLENVNQQLPPIPGEDLDSILKTSTPQGAVSGEEGSQGGMAPTPPEGGRRGGGDDTGALDGILDQFNDFTPAGRAAAEGALFSYFQQIVAACPPGEGKGAAPDVLKAFEEFFEKTDALGYGYHFQTTPERDAFTTRLAGGWMSLPYTSRWAAIRMLGILGGEDAHAALSRAMRGGIFEDEAAVALMRQGDTSSLPILIDYLSRGRITGSRLREVEAICVTQASPALVEGLIGFLDNPDVGMRSAARSLLQRIAGPEARGLAGTEIDDPELTQRWRSWWSAAKASYAPPPPPGRQIVALTLMTGMNSLRGDGQFTRTYFAELGRSIEQCCRELGAPDLTLHAKGELALYRMAREMVQGYGTTDRAGREVMEQYMSAFVDEVYRLCLRQRFPESPERASFVTWAISSLAPKQVPSLIFVVRILGITGDPTALPQLKKFGGTWVPGVRKSTVISMGLLGDQAAIGEIGKYCADTAFSAADGDACIVALDRIDARASSETLIQIMRGAKPLLAYDAYRVIRRRRGGAGRLLSLEQFEQGKDLLAEEYSAWLKGAGPKTD
ncbi:MAG: hypothetical protein NT045_06850 [Candidatus Aureabacteria bacterium]|nr:hypothetical protein [Candidatus Auribacterota bacterium]